jgi:hypothetical protein
MTRKHTIYSVIILALTIGVGLVALPNFIKARAVSSSNAGVNNLRLIAAAKDQWAIEHAKTTNDTPTWDDLRPYFGREMNQPLKCPQGGIYTLGKIGQSPTCSLGGNHSIP